jgi:hypothetical protein
MQKRGVPSSNMGGGNQITHDAHGDHMQPHGYSQPSQQPMANDPMSHYS